MTSTTGSTAAFVLVLLCAAPAARADTPAAFDVELARANAAGKILMIAFSSAECDACDRFERDILPAAPIQQTLGAFVYVEYDIHEATGAEVARRFAVTNVPAFVAVDPAGIERSRLTTLGSEPGVAFLAFARAAAPFAIATDFERGTPAAEGPQLDPVDLLDQAFVVAAVRAGVVSGLELGGRALFRVATVDLFHVALTVDGAAGIDGDGERALYDARAMVGLGTGRGTTTVGLIVGVGISRAGDVLARAPEIPAELYLAITGAVVRGNLWVRSAWIGDVDARRDGAKNSFLTSDELSAGFLVRLPARSRVGLVVGAEYIEAREQNGASVFVGFSLDSLL